MTHRNESPQPKLHLLDYKIIKRIAYYQLDKEKKPEQVDEEDVEKVLEGPDQCNFCIGRKLCIV